MNGVLLAAMTLGAAAMACSDASSCPSLDGVRARMTNAPAVERSSLVVVHGADGEGRVDRAIVVRLIPGANADALKVQLDDGPERLWDRGSLKDTLFGEIDAALAAGRPHLFEVEAPPFTHSISLALLLHGLSSRGEVRLMVAKLIEPPYKRLPAWALQATQPDTVQIDATTISDALRRAAGKRCAADLDRRIGAAMKNKDHIDEHALRVALPDALASCGCRGADVDATAWLYEVLAFPTLRTSWIRAQVVEGSTVIRGRFEYAGELIQALAKMPLATRAAGVWVEQPF